ncbi:MAG: hypothetical protein PHX87_04360 [Candidatus Peribacteraceae bacterium]|nr:hypothetical protein [Candidatus Peribacteraceae bacterium]MDD5742632.1 hypothetical protein [Candidatus Peribacteraceae bacterium]
MTYVFQLSVLHLKSKQEAQAIQCLLGWCSDFEAAISFDPINTDRLSNVREMPLNDAFHTLPARITERMILRASGGTEIHQP